MHSTYFYIGQKDKRQNNCFGLCTIICPEYRGSGDSVQGLGVKPEQVWSSLSGDETCDSFSFVAAEAVIQLD